MYHCAGGMDTPVGRKLPWLFKNCYAFAC